MIKDTAASPIIQNIIMLIFSYFVSRTELVKFVVSAETLGMPVKNKNKSQNTLNWDNNTTVSIHYKNTISKK